MGEAKQIISEKKLKLNKMAIAEEDVKPGTRHSRTSA